MIRFCQERYNKTYWKLIELIIVKKELRTAFLNGITRHVRRSKLNKKKKRATNINRSVQRESSVLINIGIGHTHTQTNKPK